MAEDQKKPRGEQAVTEALLAAAVHAYSEGTFSVRKIADRANVNHGQVHHYFGGLRELKRQVLEHLGRALLKTVESREASNPGHLTRIAVQALLRDRRFVKALARRVLEAPDEKNIQTQFPVTELLQKNIGHKGAPSNQMALANGLARTLGWALFEPWISQALSLSDVQVQQIEHDLIEFDEPRIEDA